MNDYEKYHSEIQKPLKVVNAIKAFESTFDLNSKKLPSRKILLDVNEDFETSLLFRKSYLKHSYVAYTDEMLNSLKIMCENMEFKKIHELNCGTGWFSHWMKKYGIPLDKSIDNKSWTSYKKDNSFLPLVTEMDSRKFVEDSSDADLYILSWPYMDSIAADIWKKMEAGQHLLYIGERMGGCTADDEFFHLVEPHEILNENLLELQKTFVQFKGLYDNFHLYKKV